MNQRILVNHLLTYPNQVLAIQVLAIQVMPIQVLAIQVIKKLQALNLILQIMVDIQGQPKRYMSRIINVPTNQVKFILNMNQRILVNHLLTYPNQVLAIQVLAIQVMPIQVLAIQVIKKLQALNLILQIMVDIQGQPKRYMSRIINVPTNQVKFILNMNQRILVNHLLTYPNQVLAIQVLAIQVMPIQVLAIQVIKKLQALNLILQIMVDIQGQPKRYMSRIINVPTNQVKFILNMNQRILVNHLLTYPNQVLAIQVLAIQPYQLVHKDTVIVQSNLASNVLMHKRELDSKMQAIPEENKKPTNTSATLPLIMLTKDNFTPMWCSWKNEFLTYMKSIDQVGKNSKEKWGIMLLNRLGPSGQEIFRMFNFDDGQDKEDINVLFEKFDQYCTLERKTRKTDEDIDTYVNNLKVMASKYTNDVDEVVKKKILEEVDKNKFTSSAVSLMPNFSFSFRVKSLSVQEITYIWMKCENVNFKQREKIDNYLVKNCSNCSYIHDIGRCPAYGKQCKNCGNMNHYSKRCPSQCKDNCSFCGDSHFFQDCPSYMNECSKCHRLHHFRWMCGLQKIVFCKFCGSFHIMSRRVCPAINNICSNCNKVGHFPEKCSN
ncbi:PREDICTED: uncharacterized protein LOC106747855 [Dinoponera quadriceps]|uniref:Uncharacterized protein LOC106747855 n=1 Tax=Dinoponera quadriceps TaxID=609295 RepID=A0A6P3XRZ2_DINQU|nr:PREDICTED: uncharacterized protein LOC106747855 [Dinoponera quadriceps]